MPRWLQRFEPPAEFFELWIFRLVFRRQAKEKGFGDGGMVLRCSLTREDLSEIRSFGRTIAQQIISFFFYNQCTQVKIIIPSSTPSSITVDHILVINHLALY